MKSHRDLDVWKRGVDFAVDIYKLTASFPAEEKYALSSQLKRAAVSIASNIAEGAARQSEKEFIQFLHIAMGSAAETETQLMIAARLGLIDNNDNLFSELEAIQKMLMGLVKYVKKSRE